MTLLCLYNGNAWALLAIPLIEDGHRNWKLPRFRWAFYAYYVAHLAVFLPSQRKICYPETATAIQGA
ncbi:hypothetical protein GDR29_09510 [Xanthomonas oryzae pv. oryzae]|nr:hypothetical protein GDR29_09510 [Xanthomonas oryzae pv. oryzae]